MGRRDFLKFLGRSASVSLSAVSTIPILPGCSHNPVGQTAFTGLKPTLADELRLLSGLNYHVIAKFGDTINLAGDTFGDHNDFLTFFPLNGSPNEGLLWVNHESLSPQFVHGKPVKSLTRSKEEIRKEQYVVGGSIIHIKKEQGKWNLVRDSKYNRRISGLTKIPFSHSTAILGSKYATGTIANCAGGKTPWNTVLTSEENYHIFYGESDYRNGHRHFVETDKFSWYTQSPMPPEHYGWVVEIDPFTGKSKKQIKLGRAGHEGATVALTKSQAAVVYMGEDRPGGYIFKFVSKGKNLDDGMLYAADTINGNWLPLDLNINKKLQSEFKNQLDVLIYSHRAAEVAGATPQDRPEDIEIDPQTNNIIISLTNNYEAGNKYGSLLKIAEAADFDSASFTATTWINGGPETGFACPDNLAFDNKGNLWFTTDVSEKDIGKGAYKFFGNNGLFYIPMQGPGAGVAIQLGSAPVDAELTGPWFSPDYKTLFLSVQHPGASSKNSPESPSSRWPEGGGDIPRSAVVAIGGPLLEKLTT